MSDPNEVDRETLLKMASLLHSEATFLLHAAKEVDAADLSEHIRGLKTRLAEIVEDLKEEGDILDGEIY